MLAAYLRLRSWFEDQSGQDLIEYALLVMFIAIIVFVVLPYVGTQISTVFNTIRSSLPGGGS